MHMQTLDQLLDTAPASDPMREFAAMLAELARPNALPDGLLPGSVIEVRQTHGSAVMLVGGRARKYSHPGRCESNVMSRCQT